MSRALFTASALLASVAIGCTKFPPDSMRIQHGVLTVDNQTPVEWRNVEIWINRYFRITVPAIAAGGRFRVPLDSFVSGYAQRFDVRRMTINDLRLTALRPDGTPVTVIKQPPRSGLAALERKSP